MRFLKRSGLVLLALAFALWLGNSSWLTGPSATAETRLLAHRGVHQIYAGADRTNDTCRAREIGAITHGYIENTLPSIAQAFDLGADVVELDVHLTPDGVFAVFHDWTLDCQTNGSGVTETVPFDTLKTLDIGYGFTDDGGQTFPLRGTGIGLMPNLRDVLEAAHGPVLVNFKSRRTDEGEVLAKRLKDWGLSDQVWAVYGGAEPTRAALAAMPDMRGYDKQSLIACLKSYALWGWSGHVPAPCRDTLIAIPQDYAPFLWSWPHRLTKRLKAHGSDVILLGPYDGSGFSSGIETPEALARVPAGFDGYLWTNRIEVIGPLVKP